MRAGDHAIIEGKQDQRMLNVFCATIVILQVIRDI